MSQAGEQTMDQVQQSADSQGAVRMLSKFGRLLGLGVLSVGLYFLLYWFNGDIKAAAMATNTGDKALFFVPIIVALVFSFVHGAFTSQFWDALGVKAKKS